jgi:hypothetical protein
MLADKMGPLGPIVPEALTNLEGWTWKSDGRTDRIMLTRGASPVNILPPIQSEIGWLHAIGVIFSDPMSMFHFTCDNYTFAFSPFFFRLMGNTLTNNVRLYCSVYNPASPLGPLYGLAWDPAKFWPYRSQIQMQASHPSTALTPTSQVVMFMLGRQYIRDRKQFYESIVIENTRQSVGRVEVPRRGS